MGPALMRNAQQAVANTSVPVHHHGVIVDFPAVRVPSPAPAASDPGTPDASIALSRVQAGDARNFSAGEDVSAKIQGPSQPENVAKPGFDTLRETVPPSPERFGRQHPGISPTGERSGSVQVHVNAPRVPMSEPIRPKKNWLERWLHPEPADKRKVRRVPTPGLIAYFWTGGPPQAQRVRDISASGLYVITDERWYLGTIITLTLTKEFGPGSERERSITMQATAVRHGKDGVGLKFVLDEARDPRLRQPLLGEGGNGQQLDEFLEGFQGS